VEKNGAFMAHVPEPQFLHIGSDRLFGFGGGWIHGFQRHCWRRSAGSERLRSSLIINQARAGGTGNRRDQGWTSPVEVSNLASVMLFVQTMLELWKGEVERNGVLFAHVSEPMSLNV
jgi:hypothetical protein